MRRLQKNEGLPVWGALVRVCIKHCCPILIFMTLPKFPIDTPYQVYLSLHFESHQIFLKSGLKICLENQS